MSVVSDQEWIEYKEKFNKTYNNDTEDKMRRELYVKSKHQIEEHNKKYEAGDVTYKMGINHMSDFTQEEYSVMTGRRIPPKSS